MKIKEKKSIKGVFTPVQIATLAREIAMYLPRTAAASLALGKKQFSRRGREKRHKYINPILVDTSVLIDGRLADIAKSGFLFGTFLILPSVVAELHKLSDSSDKVKRMRGRRGLDEVAQLRSEKSIKLEVLDKDPEGETVDGKLVKVARKMRAKLLTLDFNLNKVAKISKVTVLNLNELANAVKTVVLPGERLSVQVSARGAQRQQGVGYLADGTMVVVEEGAGQIGKKIEVAVDKVLQTAAGKMVFGKISE